MAPYGSFVKSDLFALGKNGALIASDWFDASWVSCAQVSTVPAKMVGAIAKELSRYANEHLTLS